MSHKGTIPIRSTALTFTDCLEAVDNCDVFIGIINGRYGSGKIGGEPSITHQEMRRALELNKVRFCLVHEHVELARQILKPFLLPEGEGPFRLTGDGSLEPILWPKTNPVLSDLRVLGMYREMLREDVPLEERTGNWVQKYADDNDALIFLQAQFRDPQRLQELIASQKV